MLTEHVLDAVLTVAIVNSTLWSLLALVAFSVYRVPAYHPMAIYLFYHLLGFVVRPWVVYFGEFSYLWFRIGYPLDVNDIYWAALVVNLGLIAIAVGVLLGLEDVRRDVGMPPRAAVYFQKPNGAAVIFVLLLLISLISIYKGVGDSSEIFSYALELDSRGGKRLDGQSGYVTSLALMAPALLILLILCRAPLLLIVVAVSSFVALRIYVGSGRTSFVVVLLAAVLYVIYWARMRFPPIWTLVTGAVAAFVFEVVGNDRLAIRRVLDGTMGVAEMLANYFQNRGKAMFTNDAQEFDVATAVIAVHSNEEVWNYGSQFLRLFIWPIPRQLWADKPVFTSLVNLPDYGAFEDLTVTFYGDVYSIAGLFTLVLFCFCLGYFFSRMYRGFCSTASPVYFVWYWVFVMYLFLILRDGGVTVAIFWGFSMFAIYAVAKLGQAGLRRE